MRYFTLLGLFAAASTQPNNSSYLRRHCSPPPPPRLVTPMYDFVEVLLALEKGKYAHVAVIYPCAAEFFRRAHELGHRPVVVSLFTVGSRRWKVMCSAASSLPYIDFADLEVDDVEKDNRTFASGVFPLGEVSFADADIRTALETFRELVSGGGDDPGGEYMFLAQQIVIATHHRNKDRTVGGGATMFVTNAAKARVNLSAVAGTSALLEKTREDFLTGPDRLRLGLPGFIGGRGFPSETKVRTTRQAVQFGAFDSLGTTRTCVQRLNEVPMVELILRPRDHTEEEWAFIFRGPRMAEDIDKGVVYALERKGRHRVEGGAPSDEPPVEQDGDEFVAVAKTARWIAGEKVVFALQRLSKAARHVGDAFLNLEEDASKVPAAWAALGDVAVDNNDEESDFDAALRMYSAHDAAVAPVVECREAQKAFDGHLEALEKVLGETVEKLRAVLGGQALKDWIKRLDVVGDAVGAADVPHYNWCKVLGGPPGGDLAEATVQLRAAVAAVVESVAKCRGSADPLAAAVGPPPVDRAGPDDEEPNAATEGNAQNSNQTPGGVTGDDDDFFAPLAVAQDASEESDLARALSALAAAPDAEIPPTSSSKHLWRFKEGHEVPERITYDFAGGYSMSIDTIELCSSRDVGQGGVGGTRKCDLADIGATMAKCYDDARREGSPIDLITWDEANRTARGDARVTHNAGALRGRQLLDAEFRKAMTEGKITASVTTSQDELSPVSMIVRSSASNGSYNIEFAVEGANYKKLPPLFAHAACVAVELTLDDSERAWVVLSLCNEALWDELSERLVKGLHIQQSAVGACLDDGDIEWGGNSTLSPELRAAIKSNVCRPSQLKARVDACVDDWVQLVRRQLDLVFPLESGPAPFETATEFVDALVEASSAAAVDVPSRSKPQPLRVPRSGAGCASRAPAPAPAPAFFTRGSYKVIDPAGAKLRSSSNDDSTEVGHLALGTCVEVDGVMRKLVSTPRACVVKRGRLVGWVDLVALERISATSPDTPPMPSPDDDDVDAAVSGPAARSRALAPAPAPGPAASNGLLFVGALVKVENADSLGWPGSRGTVVSLGNDHVDVELEIDYQPLGIIKRVWAPASGLGPLRIIVETASERADRKAARERRRRAEEKDLLEELDKALDEAEKRCAGSVPRLDAATSLPYGVGRIDLLQRAIDVVRALTKACVDAKRAAAAVPAPATAPAPAPAPAGGPAASNGLLFVGARVELENADLLGWPSSRGTVITLGNDHVDVDLEIDGQPSSIIKRVWALRIIDDDQSSDGGGRSLKGDDDDDDDDATLSDTELERHERETVAATNAANAAIASARDCETDSEDELERARVDEGYSLTNLRRELLRLERAPGYSLTELRRELLKLDDHDDEILSLNDWSAMESELIALEEPKEAELEAANLYLRWRGNRDLEVPGSNSLFSGEPYAHQEWQRMNAEAKSPEEVRAASRLIGAHGHVSSFDGASTALGLQIHWNALYNVYQRLVLRLVSPMHFATVVAPEGPPRHVESGPGKRRRIVAAPASTPAAGLVSTPAPALVQPHGLPRDNPGDGGAARQRFPRDHHTAARRSAAPSRLAAYHQVRGSIFP